MSFLVLLGLFFLISIQPIFMVISLVFMVILYSMFMYKVMSSYWFSYILLLVMLSGVMVIFMYVVSLMPNESFEIYNLIFVVLFIIMMYKWDFFKYVIDYSYISMNLWFSYVGLMNLFMVGFLLSVMVMVVWLSCLSEGAVRVMY